MNATHLATQIIDQVDQLPFSDTNSYELMSLANKAYVFFMPKREIPEKRF